MSDQLRRPRGSTYYDPAEKDAHELLRRRAWRKKTRQEQMALVMSGPISPRLLEEALARGGSVELAAIIHHPLTSAQIDYYLGTTQDPFVWESIVRYQTLEPHQVDTALSLPDAFSRQQVAATQKDLTVDQITRLLEDHDPEVRIACLTHQTLDADQIRHVLTTGDDREREALATEQRLSAADISDLLTDPNPEVRVATAQNHALNRDQVGQLLDLDANGTDAEQELRRVAIIDATPDQLRAHAADPDPVVAAHANELLTERAAELAAALVADHEARALRDPWEIDAAWLRASEREIGVDDVRTEVAQERAEQWWFDEAWRERQAIVSVIGTRPDGPDLEQARLNADRHKAAADLARLQSAADRLPPGHEDVLTERLRDVQADLEAIDARRAAFEASVADGTHPDVVDQMVWDLKNGDLATRAEVLTTECMNHMVELSAADGRIPPAPASDLGKEAWLIINSDMACVINRFERTGTLTEQDNRRLIELRREAVERATTYGRYGYDAVAEVERSLQQAAAGMSSLDVVDMPLGEELETVMRNQELDLADEVDHERSGHTPGFGVGL